MEVEGERCRERRRICTDRRRRHGRVRGDGGARRGAGRGQRTGQIYGQVRAASDGNYAVENTLSNAPT